VPFFPEEYAADGPGMPTTSFRATRITAYLDRGGTIEQARQIAAHESPRTTQIYDRTPDKITLDEIERIPPNFSHQLHATCTYRRFGVP
jgi:hypothetical protein